MAKIMFTDHKVIKFLGFKIVDIWEDYLERRMINDEILTTDNIPSDDYSDKKDNDK